MAHTAADITKGRTLTSLYLDPINAMLEERVKHDEAPRVFPLAPDVPLQLLLDVKEASTGSG